VTGEVPLSSTFRKGRHRGSSALTRLAGVAIASLAILSVGSCGATSSSAPVDQAVSVELKNFEISAPAQVHAGLVRFDLHGLGPTMHEFVIARTNRKAGDLPLAADDTVDDHGEYPGFTLLGEEEGIDMNDKAAFTVRLTPGHYVLFCNMEGHYLAGMHREVTVP
jgi:uncharacterized cupredoxin-like copper-binding protein